MNLNLILTGMSQHNTEHLKKQNVVDSFQN